jgi:hypothetical protein
VFLLLIFYGSVFLTIGIAVSATTHRSSTSLVTLLIVWVFLVVLIPLGAVYLGRFIKPLPSRYVIERGIVALNERNQSDPELKRSGVAAVGFSLDASGRGVRTDLLGSRQWMAGGSGCHADSLDGRSRTILPKGLSQDTYYRHRKRECRPTIL